MKYIILDQFQNNLFCIIDFFYIEKIFLELKFLCFADMIMI